MTSSSLAPAPDARRAGDQGAAATHLRAVLGVLDAHHLDVALVRDPGRDGAGRLEADLLVRPSQRDAVELLLAAEGFRRRPGWGRQPHRFHLRPVTDPGHDQLDWLKVDLVTDLCYGPVHELSTGAADACLDARIREPFGARRLQPADELMALLLHGLLDRDQLRLDQRGALAALATPGLEPGVLAHHLFGDAVDRRWQELLSAIQEGDWGTVLAARPQLRVELRDGRRIASTLRGFRNRTARRLAKPLTAVAARGALVALVGPDGTGKSTLAGTIGDAVGLPTRVLYGGTHPAGTHTSRVPGATTARITLRLLATRALIAWHRGRGRLVVLDRHPLQVRPRAGSTLSARARARRRFLSITLPRPDLLLVLDAPASVLHRRRPEHTVEQLETARGLHVVLAVTRDRARILDATATPARVLHDAVQLIWSDALAPASVRRTGARS
ncbi:hypothetical protein BH10ACT1_BH10ACT1_22600 [soil metagenome]